MSAGDIFSTLMALVAAGCFAALIALQVMENEYYKGEQNFGNVWPATIQAPAK